MPAKSVRPSRQTIYLDIRTAIITGELEPGQHVSETDLGTKLNVSRTPVREALVLLAREGLINAISKVGTFVAPIDPSKVAEAQFLREAVELASIRSIAFPLDDAVVAAVEHNLLQQAKVVDDFRAFFELDEQFHRLLMALAGHEESWHAISAAKGHLDRARMIGMKDLHSSDFLLDQHRAIFDSVLAEELEQAAVLLQAHVRGVYDDIAILQRERPGLFTAQPRQVQAPVSR